MMMTDALRVATRETRLAALADEVTSSNVVVADGNAGRYALICTPYGGDQDARPDTISTWATVEQAARFAEQEMHAGYRAIQIFDLADRERFEDFAGVELRAHAHFEPGLIEVTITFAGKAL